MKTVLDSFWEVVDEVKSNSSLIEPIRNPFHPLNSLFHPLRSIFHPLQSPLHSTNNIMNPQRGKERARTLRELLDEYMLPYL